MHTSGLVSMLEATEATKWLQSCWMFEAHGHRPAAVKIDLGSRVLQIFIAKVLPEVSEEVVQ